MPKYSLPDPGTVIISSSAVDKLIESKNGDAALVYLYLLKAEGNASPEEIAGVMHTSLPAVRRCIDQLSAMGLVNSGAARSPGSSTEYTADELARALKNEEFSFISDEAERVFGRVLSVEDLKRLYNIYHGVGMPPEVILHMMQFFKSEVRRKYGPGRSLSMPAMEKMAFEWSRLGIVTLEDAEDHIRLQEKRTSMEGEIKRALEIFDRRLSAGEQTYVNSWTDMGFGPDSIKIAYERTIDRVHNRSFKYMDKIFLSWHSKGLHTPEEIEKGDPYEAPRHYSSQKPASQAPPTATPTAADTESLRRLLESMKGD